MALVIEDGSGVIDANSFATEAEIIAYAAARGVVIPEAVVAVHAIKAMDFFFTICLKGEIAYPGEQWTLYPRVGLVDGDTAPGAILEVPINAKLAQMQLALDSFNGIDLTPSRKAEPRLKKRTTGPIEREYFEGASADTPVLPMADAFLGPLKCGQLGRIRTYRA